MNAHVRTVVRVPVDLGVPRRNTMDTQAADKLRTDRHYCFMDIDYCFLYHGDQKISWWKICRWRPVNFEIHLCSSSVNSDLRECFFRGPCKPVITSTDLWPQEVFTFLKMHASGRSLAWTCLKQWKQFRCHPGERVRLSWESCGASCTDASCKKFKWSDVPPTSNLDDLHVMRVTWKHWSVHHVMIGSISSFSWNSLTGKWRA